MQQTETRIQMIKMHGKRIETHRRPFCTPKPDADLWMRVDLSRDQKTVENQDWATRPPDLRATRPSQAVGGGQLGLRAAGPSRAVGRRPLSRGPAFSKTT